MMPEKFERRNTVGSEQKQISKNEQNGGKRHDDY